MRLCSCFLVLSLGFTTQALAIDAKSQIKKAIPPAKVEQMKQQQKKKAIAYLKQQQKSQGEHLKKKYASKLPFQKPKKKGSH